MSENAPGSRVGTLFGHYRLRRLLGRGGMGEVYEAHDTVKDRVVALKLMTQDLSADPVFRQRMQREAHTAGRLQEPHIVPIHDYGEIDGQLFIDMRFIEGTDVAKLLSRHGPMPPPQAVAIIRQIAAALDAAHLDGVMHRDVKPENILITGGDFAYLVDFGIAAAATDQRLTHTGAAVGTWNYMAPERFGNDEVTYRADIYALACVLHECLTGTTPYLTDSLPALMAAHLTRPAPRPSQQRPGLPAAFDEVVAIGMAKDPGARYTRAADLAVAAHHALSTSDQHRSVTLLEHSRQSAPPPTAPSPWTQPVAWRPPPPPPNRRPWLVLGAVGLVVIVALGAMGIWLGTRDTDGPQAAGRTTITSTTTKAIPTLVAAQLDSILLSPTQISAIMSAVSMQRENTSTAMADPVSTLTPDDCRGALYPGQNTAYAGTGYTAVSGQRLSTDNHDHDVIQSAVSFGTADQALAFVTSSATKWRACGGQTVTQIYEGTTVHYKVENLVGDVPKITQINRQENGGTCQRALSVVSNVVFDIAACSFQVTDQAGQIADAMAAKMPGG